MHVVNANADLKDRQVREEGNEKQELKAFIEIQWKPPSTGFPGVQVFPLTAFSEENWDKGSGFACIFHVVVV